MPERAVQAKGSGSHGEFAITADILTFIKAEAPQKGAMTSMITRCTTATGEPSPAEAE